LLQAAKLEQIIGSPVTIGTADNLVSEQPTGAQIKVVRRAHHASSANHNSVTALVKLAPFVREREKGIALDHGGGGLLAPVVKVKGPVRPCRLAMARVYDCVVKVKNINHGLRSED
jgi:hypothetical protein